MNLGELGEILVLKEYLWLGYRLVARNVKMHGYRQIGEIDLIVSKGMEIVFVEVKTRSKASGRYGTALDAVGYFKQKKLRQAVKLFLLKNPIYDGWCWRIDVAEVAIDNSENNVIILENAIEDID